MPHALSARDIFLALLVIIVWAANVIAVKLAVVEAPPLTVLALRFGLTGLVFLPFVCGLTRPALIGLAQIALLMGVLHQGLLFVGMTYLPAGITSILLQTQVIFAALIGIFIFREHTGWRTWTGIGLGVAGVAVMFSAGAAGNGISGETFITGFGIMILSTLSLAFAYMRLKQLPSVAPATFLFGINGLAFPLVALAAVLFDRDGWNMLPDANWLLLGGVFAFQIVFVGLSHIVWQRLLSRNPLSMVTPFVLLLPVFGVIMAIAVLGEKLTMSMLAGGTVTMLGVAIIIVRGAVKKRAPKDPLSQSCPLPE